MWDLIFFTYFCDERPYGASVWRVSCIHWSSRHTRSKNFL